MIFIGKYKGKPIFKNNYDEYFIRYDGELYMYLFIDSYYCNYIINPITVDGKVLCGVTIPENRLYLTSADCRKFETCIYCEIYKSISIREYKGEYFFNFNRQTFEGFTSIEEVKDYIDILIKNK